MHWFLIALLAQLLWSVSNHSDKYLLSKYFKKEGMGTLILYSSVFSIFVLPVAFYLSPNVLHIGVLEAGMLVTAGIVNIVAIVMYLFALKKDDVSLVVPFFQIIPFFSYVLGYFFLGEQLNVSQIIAGLIIIVGAVVLSVEVEDDQKSRFHLRVLYLMLGASFLMALFGLLFKKATLAIDGNFWTSVFWENIGLLLVALFLFVALPKSRREFITLFKTSGPGILSLNILSESSTIVGNILFNFASLLAPLVLVSLVGSFQPLFVFILGIVLTIFLPKISQEKITHRHIIQKTLAISIMLLGSYLLFR